MMRSVALVALLGSPVFADPSAADPPEPSLGTPLPGRSAYPALGSLTPYTMSGGVLYVPSLPAINVGGVTAPRGSATYFEMGFTSSVGGLRPGLFGYYSIGGSIGLRIGGDAARSFSALDKMYVGGTTSYFSITPLAPGIGYRTRRLLFGIQLAPRIEWFTEDFTRDKLSVSGRDHFYALHADVQGCLQYNTFGIFPKNSAVCVFVAPVVYRSGWLEGAAVGLRWYPL